MTKPRIFLVTNLANESTEDTEVLGPALRQWFEVTLLNPADAAPRLKEVDLCLIRNAWPEREMKHDLRKLAAAVRASGVPSYNPVRANSFAEDKTYLARLTNDGLPVIPTVLDKADAGRLGKPARYLIKPLDGCGSEGIQKLDAAGVAVVDLAGNVLQPLIEIARELSFFFIDDTFVYALRTKTGRWDLESWTPDAAELAFAKQFVDWNKMPYGLQRIDVALQPDGTMLLLEIEDFSPFLSLQILLADLRARVIEALAQSVLRRAKAA